MTVRRPWFGGKLEALDTQRTIAIGFAVVLALMALLAGLGLAHMTTLKQRMVKLSTESNVKIESVYQMRSVSRERFASLAQLVVLRDPFDRDEEYLRFMAQAEEFIRARDRLLGLGMGPEESAAWNRARHLIQRDEQFHRQIIELALTDRQEDAMTVLLRDVRPIEQDLLETFNDMIEQYRQANQRALSESDAGYRMAVVYMLTLALLALLMGMAVAWFVVLRSRHAEMQLSRQNQAVTATAKELSWAASHDSLTGLANRREMRRRLSELLHETRSRGACHVLLYIDLDRFKLINDSCGHFAGDEVLRQVAAIFMRHVRSGDLVARLGGDEFCIGLVNCPDNKAYQIAEAIRDEIDQYRFTWENRVFQVGASIGLVKLAPDMEVDQALKVADAACYQAKKHGRNQVCMSSDSRAV